MSKLEIFDRRGNRYYIAWVVDGDEGAALGDVTHTLQDLENAKTRDDRECILATLTAEQTIGWERGSYGLEWETITQAKGALRAVRAALRSDTGIPWPEWAVKAKAEGWTPPKGWRPS